MIMTGQVIGNFGDSVVFVRSGESIYLVNGLHLFSENKTEVNTQIYLGLKVFFQAFYFRGPVKDFKKLIKKFKKLKQD